MKNIKLDTILLFSLLVPFIMAYRISPGDTPFWLFGLIFLGLILYALFDIMQIGKEKYFRLKEILLWLLIIFSIGGAFYSAIAVRHMTSPLYMIHDIILQLESAIRFLLHGINPYSASYFGTPLEQWHFSDTQLNPALFHFVMEPFYLLFSAPFYLLSTRTIGFFDGRIPLFFLFFSLLVGIKFLIKDKEKRLLCIIFLAFNPAQLGYTLEGRSDIFVFTFLFFGLYFLHKKKYSLSSIVTALAFVVKQSVWPLFPLYFAYLYFREKSFKKIIKPLILFIFTFTIVTLPFFLWNQKAFIDSTISYLSGNVEHSYPISGYGFGMILLQLGMIKDVNAYYPFVFFQLLFSLPVFILLIKYLRKTTTISRLILFYGILLFVFWYFSRYFNNSHIGYLSMIFILAHFWPEEKE